MFRNDEDAQPLLDAANGWMVCLIAGTFAEKHKARAGPPLQFSSRAPPSAQGELFFLLTNLIMDDL